MIVLGTQIGVKSVAICPKTNDIIVCSVLDEAENKYYDLEVVSVIEDQYYTTFTFDQSIEFVEGRFYMMYLYDSNQNVAHREKIYCTDQPIATYSVNDGQYKVQTQENEFVVI
jgi:hypothetical protein